MSNFNFISIIRTKLQREVHIAPLVTFRIVFGLMMLGSMLRFWAKGWIYELYIAPKVYFTYYGFEWVRPLGEVGTYLLFGLLIISSLFVALGFLYKYATTTFFLGFTYVELIDKTNYLNHYYFISIVAALLIFLPANRYFSLDERLGLVSTQNKVPFWNIGAIRLQLGIVYFFAGIAKLNYDWLMRAMPLKLWLPAHASLPFVGGLLSKTWLAFAFSWFGAIYDLLIPFALSVRKFRWLAYSAVISFHVITGYLFQIGMFPYIMIMATLVFFSESFHRRLIGFLARALRYDLADEQVQQKGASPSLAVLKYALIAHFAFQIIFPFRYVFYGDNLFWHEQGYRFGWRVMLMEKAGQAYFFAENPSNGARIEIRNSDYLAPHQEKQMATQPDMILQFAQMIQSDLAAKGFTDVQVKAETFVTINGSGSRPFINPNTNLCEVRDSWKNKDWILPFEQL